MFPPALCDAVIVFQQGLAICRQEWGGAGSLWSVDSLEQSEELFGVVQVGVSLNLISFPVPTVVLHCAQFSLGSALEVLEAILLGGGR